MGQPYFLTLAKTSTAIDSGVGRVNFGLLHSALAPTQSAHMQRESMNNRKAL